MSNYDCEACKDTGTVMVFNNDADEDGHEEPCAHCSTQVYDEWISAQMSPDPDTWGNNELYPAGPHLSKTMTPEAQKEFKKMVHELFKDMIEKGEIEGYPEIDNPSGIWDEEADMLWPPPGVHKKSLPKGVDPTDFIKYMEECVSGDLPCNSCEVVASEGEPYVPWFQCPHHFKHGPMTPMKKVIISKLKSQPWDSIAKKKKITTKKKKITTPWGVAPSSFSWTPSDDEIIEGATPQASPLGQPKKKKNNMKITLGDEQANFIDLSQMTGPEDEKFLDPDWEHCHNESCGSCYKHTLHHGIQHSNHNPDGEKISIYQQCINKHGEHDIFGKKISPTKLKAYLHPETGMATPIQQQQIEQIQTGGTPLTAIEEKKMPKTHIIAAKGRAKKILKIVERFDISWRDSGEEGFYNIVRCSPFYLNQFLTVFLKNLLKGEAKKIFKQEMNILCDSLDEMNSRLEIEDMVQDYYRISVSKRVDLVEALTVLLGRMLNDVIDVYLANGQHMGPVHRYQDRARDMDPRTMMDCYFQTSISGPMDSIFLKAYLTYDNDEGTTLPLSQKARGIHAIGTNTTGLNMFTKQFSLHISLDAANNGTNRELIMSVARAWQGVRPQNTLSNGLYIRTCPETPRPGALPNVLAKTPRQFIDGVRMLGKCMTDPHHTDFDPNGCLVVQQFINPICSAVVVKGSNSFTIGPSNDGVTAGGGSNIVFTLNNGGARRMETDIKRLSLEDGMEHHEVELVYDSSGGTQKALTWFRNIADQRHRGAEGRIMPTITQMRGLYHAKPDLEPPPMVKGELLHIRGLIAAGSVEQLESMDVGKGSLAECLELEQMVKTGTLPDGLVVYAPSGTNGAHVAGVAGEHEFPVIFGIKPMKNHTVWTEIKGWVTTAKDVRPKPYNPQPMLDFYKIGLRDGDRFWTYNLAPLSQFFHNFISGPVNDPRLEAYLAGVYTTWITKAALAVSMAEFRHGIGSDRADISPQRAFSHILIQQSIAGESGVDNLFSRSEYYERLNYNELGYDMINAIAQFYSESYDDDIVTWCDGSFGGEKYHSSTYPTHDASSMILRMLQGKTVKIQSLLNSVNQLENAVHNTGFFFNKFLGDKNAFDIGTGGHINFKSACEHWLVTAPFYAMFYTSYVNEPHRVAKGHDKLIAHLLEKVKQHDRGNIPMRDNIGEFLQFSNEVGILRERIQAHSALIPHEHFYTEQLDRDYRMHKQGMCGYDQCSSPECKQAGILVKMGIDEGVLHKLLNELEKFMQWPTFALPMDVDSTEEVKTALLAQGNRDRSQTAFTKKERVLNQPQIECIEIAEDIFKIKISNSDIEYVYIDHILKKWWDEIEDLVSQIGEEENMITQYDAWRNPAKWIGKDIIFEATLLSEILTKAVPFTIYSRHWNTGHEAYKTPMGLIQSMIVTHDGRYNYTTHSLLKELHEAGKINEKKGEIK